MGRYILHKDGAYNIYSTVVDAPLFDEPVTIGELREYIRGEYGDQGIRELAVRLERAHLTGCSGHGETLESCLVCNRAGPREKEMTLDDFVRLFLTLDDDKEQGDE